MHSCSSLLPVPPHLPSALALSPQQRKEHKISLWKLWCVPVLSHSHPFAQTAFLANVHCSESLVWLEASGFCYTTNTRSLPGLLSDVLLLPCVMRYFSFGSVGPAPSLAPAAHRWGRYGGWSKALDLGLVAELISPPALPNLCHQHLFSGFVQKTQLHEHFLV